MFRVRSSLLYWYPGTGGGLKIACNRFCSCCARIFKLRTNWYVLGMENNQAPERLACI